MIYKNILLDQILFVDFKFVEYLWLNTENIKLKFRNS